MMGQQNRKKFILIKLASRKKVLFYYLGFLKGTFLVRPFMVILKLVSKFPLTWKTQQSIDDFSLKINKQCGVYLFLNRVNGKSYIGSSVNLRKRFNLHLAGKKSNPLLQSAFLKYGVENFVFIILELVSLKVTLLKREQFYLDLLKPEYNILTFAGSLKGYKHSETTIQKLREENLGKKNPH